jgi:hypothetical protein
MLVMCFISAQWLLVERYQLEIKLLLRYLLSDVHVFYHVTI